MKKAVYVPPKRAMEKLKYARALSETVYIGAATGYGKTQLIRYYLKSRNYCYVSCESQEWTAEALAEEMKELRAKSTARDVTVVIDDLQQLQDEDRREYLLSLSAQVGIWLILVGRSPLPKWLSILPLSGSLTRIEERDLALDAGSVAQLFAEEIRRDFLKGPEAGEIVQFTQGNGLAVHFLANRMRESGAAEGKLTDGLRQECETLFRDYLNEHVISRMDADVVDFCMQVSVVDSFDVELAEYITGQARANEMMWRLYEVSSGAEQAEDGTWHFRRPMLLALRERRDRVLEAGRVRQLCYNAGLYYETREQIVPAARMYRKSGSDRVRNLLVLNAGRNPANGYFYELRNYYLDLSEDEIRRDVALMSGMSMLCALLLDEERSEYWYHELEKYRDSAPRGRRREAEVQLLYLDIALPQRGIGNLVEIFQSLPGRLLGRGGELPELSVTSNLPSLMNGGKDFSEWSSQDRVLAASIGKVVERVLGRYGRGLVPLALAESQYEKGGDLTEIITWISHGQMQAQNGGKIEMEFVAVGLLVSIACMTGRCDEAIEQLSAFREKVAHGGGISLVENIDALRCRISLITGNLLEVEQWMGGAPDETKDFFVMRRMQYLTKVRCYIVAGQYLKAASLVEKLLVYARSYHRTMVTIEAELLMAVILYRQRNDRWRERMTGALKLAGEKQFIHCVRREGAAILPLLQEITKEPDKGGLREAVPEDWLKRVMRETARIAQRYPSYLQGENARAADFSKKDIDVLVLQAKGFSVSQIAGALEMKSETVRYHIKQNYRKLRVSSKSEAVLAARDIGLL